MSLSNGLAWSPDNKTMYFIDSLAHAVDAFDYDIEQGEISNRRTIFDIKASSFEGLLDGMASDTKGRLWIALFGGSKVYFHKRGRSVLLRRRESAGIGTQINLWLMWKRPLQRVAQRLGGR